MSDQPETSPNPTPTPKGRTWSVSRPCRVTKERIERLDGLVSKGGGTSRVLIKTSGGQTPFECPLMDIISKGCHGRLEAIFMRSADASTLVAIRDLPGSQIRIEAVDSASGEAIDHEVRNWHNVLQIPCDRFLALMITCLIVCAAFSVRAYQEHREAAIRAAAVAQVMRDVVPAASQPGITAREPQSPNSEHREVPPLGSRVIFWCFTAITALIALVVIYLLLRPFIFLLRELTDLLSEAYGRLFPAVWFNFPSMEADYAKDPARWTAIGVWATAMTFAVLWIV